MEGFAERLPVQPPDPGHFHQHRIARRLVDAEVPGDLSQAAAGRPAVGQHLDDFD
jgi:hypothetical protein